MTGNDVQDRLDPRPSASAGGPGSSFPHRLAGHCGSGALRDLLERQGLDFGDGPLSEAMVFGLSGGHGFFFGDEVPGVLFYLVGRTGSMEEDIAAHLGASVRKRQTDDPDEGWSWVKDAIDRGLTPTVWADVGELDYLRVRMHNTRHAIVVVDYDQARGIAWVADNDRHDLQACSLESLRRARNSTAFPAAARNTVLTYDWPDVLPPQADVVLAAAARTLSNMRGRDDAVGGVPGATGVLGLEQFAGGFHEWPARYGDALPDALDLLEVLIVKAGTGGAMFRSLQAGFLEEASAALLDLSLERCGARFRMLSDSWEHLAHAAHLHDHTAAAALVGDIHRLEHEALILLEQNV